MKLHELNPNPDNPRIITEERLSALRKTLEAFGDLSGFVYNRRTKQLVCGHQRREILRDAEIHIDKEYKKPTKAGTVLEGHVTVNGERFSYREVFWDDHQEKAAALAANQNAGAWDDQKLTDIFKELDAFGFDLDLTMFDEFDRATYLEDPKAKKPKNKKEPAEASKLLHECPECGHQFTTR